MNDVETGKAVGCSVEVVIAQRRRLGIPAFKPNLFWQRDLEDWVEFSPQCLKAIRLSRGLTQRGMAQICHLHQAQISRYEQSTYLRMKSENLRKIAQVLGCELEDLQKKPPTDSGSPVILEEGDGAL